jgi:hypothetical protein
MDKVEIDLIRTCIESADRSDEVKAGASLALDSLVKEWDELKAQQAQLQTELGALVLETVLTSLKPTLVMSNIRVGDSTSNSVLLALAEEWEARAEQLSCSVSEHFARAVGDLRQHAQELRSKIGQ